MQISEKIADELYEEVKNWSHFDKKSIGIQIVRSVDSIGSNIAESCGRFHFKDSINFMYYSRGSLEETRYWLRRSLARSLISKDKFNYYINLLNNLAPQINSYIRAKKVNINNN